MQKNYLSGKGMERRWGPTTWRLMQRRLQALAAVSALSDLDKAAGRCHQLHADRSEQFAMSITGSLRLVFIPDHDPIPRLEDGGVDRSRVTRIKILEVVDYHGN